MEWDYTTVEITPYTDSESWHRRPKRCFWR